MAGSPPDESEDDTVESRVREELAAREDVTEYRFREETPRSVEVEMRETDGSDAEWRLYRVESEPRPEAEEDHLHWTFLGSVRDRDE